MRKHKFKGREILECLKRIQLKTAIAGDLLTQEGQKLEGFQIIVDGQCSRHMSMSAQIGKAIKQKYLPQAEKVALDDDYPLYLDREIRRLDSMDFSPKKMLKDINKAIKKNDNKQTRVVPGRIMLNQSFKKPILRRRSSMASPKIPIIIETEFIPIDEENPNIKSDSSHSNLERM